MPGPLQSPIASKNDSYVMVQKLKDVSVGAEAIFEKEFAHHEAAFWLDSAMYGTSMSRFSFMGSGLTERSFTVHYSIAERTVSIFRPHDHRLALAEKEKLVDGSFFAWMAQQLAQLGGDAHRKLPTVDMNGHDVDVPFNFVGGMVGFWGYEMKEESMQAHNTTNGDKHHFRIPSSNTTPDAAFIFAERVVAFDHMERNIYVLAVVQPGDDVDEVKGWAEGMRESIEGLNEEDRVSAMDATQPPVPVPTCQLVQSRQSYVDKVRISQNYIKDGETYEVCLTTQVRCNIPLEHQRPFELYRHLRARNPAPYAAFLKLGPSLTIASSSPERFLQVGRDRWISMKPIKGTVKRALEKEFGSAERADEENRRRVEALGTNEKDRSENLMIVDLIRNDLNIIAEPRTVHVPALMKVESYATVHQLVSTIKGKLREDLSAVDAVKHCFPPGSMTGAPKLRTVELLEELEGQPRGPYSGALGYFSLNGAADFNVMIRTAVFDDEGISVGAGGAIVALSDPEAECAEMLLKADSVLPR
ncbi:hypothetical protein HDV00_011823 [Rhizophlyctis rosea]|nr:hypothetical protein HDV00_011823 [Rhizophlyctis rosea]